MKITEVSSAQDEKDFLNISRKIYADDPNWIMPLDKDVKAVFDPKQNKFFRHGQCTRFVLRNDQGECIGRIAAFINDKLAKREHPHTGGIGFFECINDQNAAHLLFDTGKKWLEERGMEAMDGPINFGERDSWWGLITEGFTPTPYKMNYNRPYYKDLFESYGFKTYFEQWCYSLKVMSKLLPKFYERHLNLKSNPDYQARHLRKKDLEKYAEDFRTVYNKAWGNKHGAGKDLEKKQVQKFFKSMKPVIDEKVIWYVYYKNDPIAMWVNLPDINQIFARFKGKFGWLQKLQFILLLKRRKTRKFIGLVFGIVPEFQGKGIDSFMIVEGATLIQKEKLYDDFEMQWIGDFNPKMISIAENLGTYKSRTLVTYRFLFDRTAEFKRHPMI